MLVLALQFSRGKEVERPAQRSSLELDADGTLPHNGRENEVGAHPTAGGRSLHDDRTDDDPPVHQLGRCLIGAGP